MIEQQSAFTPSNELPCTGHRQEIIDAVRDNRIVVMSGDTGCGKTTQVCWNGVIFSSDYVRIGTAIYL